jgi:hypothetical protein
VELVESVLGVALIVEIQVIVKDQLILMEAIFINILK